MLRRSLSNTLLGRCLIPALLLLLPGLGTRSALADPQRVQQEMNDYLRHNNLPSKPVTVPGGQLRRTFVPVLANTEADFLGRFNTQKGSVIWRHLVSDPAHANLMLGPTDHIGYSQKAHYNFADRLNTTKPGFYMVMALHQQEIQHMVGRFDLVGAEPMHTRTAGERITGFTRGREGCMWWLVRAETAPGVNLATTMGVHRSMAPEVLIQKLMHQGNERIHVVGIPATTVEAFSAMTAEQLLGPAPKPKAAP